MTIKLRVYLAITFCLRTILSSDQAVTQISIMGDIPTLLLRTKPLPLIEKPFCVLTAAKSPPSFQSATLSLFPILLNTNASTTDWEITLMDDNSDDWDESTLTWNTKPTNETAHRVVCVGEEVVGVTKSVDVFSLIRETVTNDPRKIATLRITGVQQSYEGNMDISTKENNTYPAAKITESIVLPGPEQADGS